MSDENPNDYLLVLMANAAQARRNQEIIVGISERSHRESAEAIHHALIRPQTGNLGFSSPPPLVLIATSLLLQTVVKRGEKTTEGNVVEAIMIPWLRIFAELKRDPNFMHQMSPAMWEEMIAGAYDLAGFDKVILTPRSGDRGRDVIASSYDGTTIRVLDQVKKYKPGEVVDYDAIRAFLFVMGEDHASKGFITTTADFPPNLMKDPFIAPHIGSRLELVNGSQLVGRLDELTKKYSM